MEKEWTPTVAVRLVKEAGLATVSAAEALYRLASSEQEARELVDLLKDEDDGTSEAGRERSVYSRERKGD